MGEKRQGREREEMGEIVGEAEPEIYGRESAGEVRAPEKGERREREKIEDRIAKRERERERYIY